MTIREATKEMRKKVRGLRAKMLSGPAGLAIREGTFRFWDHACAYCGLHAPTLDHFIPRSHGGRTHVTNLVPACRPCQRAKADRQPAEFCRSRGIDFMLIRSRMKQRASFPDNNRTADEKK